MVYMKLLHPFLAPFIEPAIDKVVSWIWGPQAVTQGCPIRPKNGGQQAPNTTAAERGGGDQQPETSTPTPGEPKSKDD